MTLKTDYTTNLNSALSDAFTAGGVFVATNLTTLSSSLVAAAQLGQRVFTVVIATSYSFDGLRLKGDLLNSYLSGIKTQLEVEQINAITKIPIEVTLSLDTSDTLTNKIKFNFTFTP
jgi:hypothetical protein